jgi:hypothetical protein
MVTSTNLKTKFLKGQKLVGVELKSLVGSKALARTLLTDVRVLHRPF